MISTPILILFASGIILTVGDIVLKSWVEKGAAYSFMYASGVALYLAGSVMLAESYKYQINIATAGVIQILFNTIILLAFTYFYFKEPLSTGQIVGVVLGVVAIWLIATK